MSNAKPLATPSPWTIFWQAGLVFVVALLVRWIGVGSNPVHVDELYHLLAGRSWAEEGTLRMLDGEYLRGRGFTMLVGSVFELFGRSDLFIARLPSIVAGALLVSALFCWLYRQAGQQAAWIGALLFGFASYAILYTQFTRFYALQALLIWLGAVWVYQAIAVMQARRALLLGVGAIIAFAVALHLQVTTVIAMLALGIWAAIDLWSRALVRQRVSNIWARPKWRWALLAFASLAIIAIALVSGSLLHQFRYTPRWAVPDQNNVLYYFLEFFFSMPILWLFLPIAGLIALAKWPRPALFCIVMTVVPLVLQSFGGMKSSRYVFYAMPFLFAIWAMAVVVLLPAAWRMIQQGVQGLQQALGLRLAPGLAYVIAAGVMSLTVLMAVIAHPIYRDTIKSLLIDVRDIARQPALLVSPPPDPPWTDRFAELRERVGQPSVLLVGDDFHAITYLGGFDLLINTHRTEDIAPTGEFVLDPRTGRRAISTPESIASVIGCYPDGVILVSDERWRSYIGLSDQAADTIERLATPSQPTIPGFRLFTWQGQAVSEGCAEIHTLVTGH
jgi:hypothetical protein